MIAPDVNVLLYALREESDRHLEFKRWLEDRLNGHEPVGLFEPVLASVLRIATHPRIYQTPTPRRIVEGYLDACTAAPAAVRLRADEAHWALFRHLCSRADCTGNLVPDAYLAALALEHGCTFATTDRDFARFADLQWHHPLE